MTMEPDEPGYPDPWHVCPRCGWFARACKCATNPEFLAGDVIRHRSASGEDNGIRYRVTLAQGGWFTAHRIRKDGAKDRRESGFSGSPLWYERVEEGPG